MLLFSSILSLGWDFASKHVGLFLVLLGVAGEIFFDWPEMKGRRAKAKKVSAILLVVGLVLDFRDAAKSDEALAETNGRAAKALQEAGEANERAAKFDVARLKVEKDAEEIRSSNLALQAKVLDLEGKMQSRAITPEKRTELIGRLKDCPKGKIVILASILDAEATNYAMQLEDVFRSAGFAVVRPELPSPEAVISIGPPGLHLVIKDRDHAPPYARPIQKSFYARGNTLEGHLGDADFDANRVELVVGQHL